MCISLYGYWIDYDEGRSVDGKNSRGKWCWWFIDFVIDVYFFYRWWIVLIYNYDCKGCVLFICFVI